MAAAVSNETIALISAGAAIGGALVGGIVTGGTTLVAESKKRRHAEKVASEERYARARVGARLVIGELMDHIASVQVERKKELDEKRKAWKFPTVQWDTHRPVLFDIVEHTGWIDLALAYISVGLCEEALARAAEGSTVGEAAMEGAIASVGEQSLSPRSGAEDGQDTGRKDETDLMSLLETTEIVLVRARKILVPVTEIGLPGRPSPQELLRISAEQASGSESEAEANTGAP
jgi:hypothetical protein